MYCNYKGTGEGYLLTGISIVHDLNFLPGTGEGVWDLFFALTKCGATEKLGGVQLESCQCILMQTSKMGSDCKSISWMKYQLMIEINLLFEKYDAADIKLVLFYCLRIFFFC